MLAFFCETSWSIQQQQHHKNGVNPNGDAFDVFAF
jgi:hypothetical protein